MMISTKGRYALRFIMDLAEHPEEGYIPLKVVAERQGISPKYLEQILPALSRARMVKATHGKGGGYSLKRLPEEYTVGEILRVMEGDMAPVNCLTCGAEECSRVKVCKTLPMWKKFYDMTNQFFDSITVADLINGVELK